MNFIEVGNSITKIIGQYKDLGPSYSGVGDLMYMRKQLATLSFLYGTFVGKHRRTKEQAAFRRKAAYLTAIQKGMNTYNATQNKLQAEIASKEQLKLEYEAEGVYHASKIILDQCNEVLGTMNQHISQLRAEVKQSFNV